MPIPLLFPCLSATTGPSSSIQHVHTFTLPGKGPAPSCGTYYSVHKRLDKRNLACRHFQINLFQTSVFPFSSPLFLVPDVCLPWGLLCFCFVSSFAHSLHRHPISPFLSLFQRFNLLFTCIPIYMYVIHIYYPHIH